MAFDPLLAERVRDVIRDVAGTAERRMFGGLAFLVDGRMFVGIRDDRLMARVGKDRYLEALGRPGARVMDFTSRVMKGYVYVDAAALRADADLSAWVRQCLDFVAGLPPKDAT